MAVGDRNETRFFGPVTLGDTSAGLGSGVVPSGQVWVIKQITLCNVSAIDRLVYMGVGTTATPANRFFSALPLAGFETLVWDTGLVLNAGERIWGFSDFAGSISVMAMGWIKEI
jgi:hypothetical protein